MTAKQVEFRAGDRVQIKLEAADDYIQPWRDRILRGLFGTVSQVGCAYGRVRVKLDMPSRAKYPHDWVWDVHPPHLLVVSRSEGETA